MVIDKEMDIRDTFFEYLKDNDRNIRWFHKKINQELEKQGKDKVSYSSIYYTFKKVYQISDEQKPIWNAILGTSF